MDFVVDRNYVKIAFHSHISTKFSVLQISAYMVLELLFGTGNYLGMYRLYVWSIYSTKNDHFALNSGMPENF